MGTIRRTRADLLRQIDTSRPRRVLPHRTGDIDTGLASVGDGATKVGVRSTAISCLEALPCPLCGDALERGAGRQGLVWICRSCRGGAVTLPILRKVAPRPFVNQLWQTALHRGRCSALVCPACTHPFTEVANALTSEIRVCVRCYWVWLDSWALDSLATLGAPRVTLAAPRAALPPPRRALPRR